MRMKIFCLPILLCTLLLLSSCAENKEKIVLKFPTAATTGAIYPLGAELANLWTNDIPYLRVSAEASNGGVQNLTLLSEGEAQVGVAVSSIAYEQQQGTGTFEGRAYDGVRVLTSLYFNPNQIVVRKNAGIQSLGDMQGKKIATGAPGSTTEVEARLHLTEAGLTYPDDISAQYVGFTEGIDLIRNKQLDGIFIMSGVPAAAVSEMLSTADCEILSVDPAVQDGLMAKYPWYTPYTISANTYNKQEQDVTTTAIRMLLLCDASVSNEAAYDMVRVFWENIDTLQVDHKALAGLSIETAATDTAGIPLHPGAEKYYTEQGVETAASSTGDEPLQ